MKLLITGPSFHNYNQSIANAFRSLNCEVEVYSWAESNSLSDLIISLIKRVNRPFAQKIINKYIGSKVSKKILRKAVETKPDAILVLKGDKLFPKTIKKIKARANAKLAVWAYDKVSKLPLLLKSAGLYDILYSFEPTDVDEISKQGIDGKFLPLAYDPSFYGKIKENLEEKLDISFVGHLHPKRKRVFQHIIKEFPNKKIRIFGGKLGRFNISQRLRYKFKMGKLAEHVVHKNISHSKINKIYNRTKICLNIHHPQSKEGLNMRAFEILGSGNFQLTDYKKEIKNLFEPDREVVCYTDLADLTEKIEYYLKNKREREKIAKNGLKKAKRKHTFKKRAKTIHNHLQQDEVYL